MFKWEEGRQNSGYYKMCLFQSKRLKLDCYLLRFDTGTSVPWHVDPAKTGKHYRANLTLIKGRGGKVELDGSAIINLSRFMLFRPDIVRHMMTEVTDGRFIMLSIGKVT